MRKIKFTNKELETLRIILGSYPSVEIGDDGKDKWGEKFDKELDNLQERLDKGDFD